MPIIETPLRSRLWAALRGRCPKCCIGKIFGGWITMNENCPVCGLKFGRESGYFFGAMYVSYALCVGFLGGLTLIGYLLLPNVPLEAIAVAAFVLYLPCVPLVFRYSRIIWIHLDRLANPMYEEEPQPRVTHVSPGRSPGPADGRRA
jgi:uncharacterized protein (DUF983 family)